MFWTAKTDDNSKQVKVAIILSQLNLRAVFSGTRTCVGIKQVTDMVVM
jgi:hypothetical protein